MVSECFQVARKKLVCGVVFITHVKVSNYFVSATAVNLELITFTSA